MAAYWSQLTQRCEERYRDRANETCAVAERETDVVRLRSIIFQRFKQNCFKLIDHLVENFFSLIFVVNHPAALTIAIFINKDISDGNVLSLLNEFGNPSKFVGSIEFTSHDHIPFFPPPIMAGCRR
jgi:hypothetical protein